MSWKTHLFNYRPCLCIIKQILDLYLAIKMIHFVVAFHLPHGHFNKFWNIPLKKNTSLIS